MRYLILMLLVIGLTLTARAQDDSAFDPLIRQLAPQMQALHEQARNPHSNTPPPRCRDREHCPAHGPAPACALLLSPACSGVVDWHNTPEPLAEREERQP